MKVLQSASACRSVEKRSCLAARSSSLVVSSVESLPRSSVGDAILLDVEADGRIVLAELDGERQPDVAEPDDADPSVLDRAQRRLSGYPAENSTCRGAAGAESHITTGKAPRPRRPATRRPRAPHRRARASARSSCRQIGSPRFAMTASIASCARSSSAVARHYDEIEPAAIDAHSTASRSRPPAAPRCRATSSPARPSSRDRCRQGSARRAARRAARASSCRRCSAWRARRGCCVAPGAAAVPERACRARRNSRESRPANRADASARDSGTRRRSPRCE